jgi:hypothetical protein
MATASGLYLIFVSIRNKIKFGTLIKRIGVFSLLFFIFSAITLFPLVELIREYGKYGAEDVSYDFFVSGSVTPVSFIYMLFPRFFSGLSYYGGYLPSSEMEIEFFIGVTTLVVLLYSIKTYLRQDSQIMMSFLMCLIIFAYMSIRFIPGFRDLVYRMPVFGSFRIPSRMLFVFLFFFYIIIALGLTKLGEGDLKLFFKFQRGFTGVIFIIICALPIIIIKAIDIIREPDFVVHIANILSFTKNNLLPTFNVYCHTNCKHTDNSSKTGHNNLEPELLAASFSKLPN